MPFPHRILLALAALTASLGASAQELARYGSAFTGEQGLEVALAPTADGTGALVRVKGVNHPIDDVVLLTEKVTEGERVFYRAQIDGRARAVLRTEGREGATRAFVLLPGVHDGVRLGLAAHGEKAVDMTALRREYQRQQRAGVQDALARFDRPAAVARQQQQLADIDANATEACATPVKTTVPWDELSDDQLQRLSIPSFCGAVAGAMRLLCSDDARFQPEASQHAQIECRFGERLRLRSEGGKILFTTEESAQNQGEFALQYLRNQ